MSKVETILGKDVVPHPLSPTIQLSLLFSSAYIQLSCHPVKRPLAIPIKEKERCVKLKTHSDNSENGKSQSDSNKRKGN